MVPDPTPSARVEHLLGRRPIAWDRPSGGYTHATRYIVKFADGDAAFVKAATDDLTAEWLLAEISLYQSMLGAFLPTVLAADTTRSPLLVLQNLSGAYWPPPWRPGDVELVVNSLAAIHATHAPTNLPSLAERRTRLESWHLVAAQSQPFLSLGMCSSEWLTEALPTLLAAEAQAPLSGDTLCHSDIRSDNICLIDQRVVFVDWNGACRGNGEFDLVAWLPSLYLEGGPAPEVILPEADPSLVALVAGYWAWRAPQPPPSLDSQVRDLQCRQLEVALPWAARRLGLPGLE
jgi:thiamine kinase-like enzyme